MTASSTPPTRKSPWYGGDIGFVVIVLALAATCITGKVLEGIPRPSLLGDNFAWMPTLSYDTQAVLATDKVRFQGQEVAFVIAETRYIAKDALELIDVEYEPLEPVVDMVETLTIRAQPDASAVAAFR